MALNEARVMKALDYKPKWSDDFDVVHAPTRSKARYEGILRLRDCYDELTFKDVIVRRNRDQDIVLPPAHRLVAELTEVERQRIMHAYGYDSYRPAKQWGYRDHYCTCPSDAVMLRLSWELGLFSGPHGESVDGNTGIWVGAFFYLTDLGKAVARSMIPTYGGRHEAKS